MINVEKEKEKNQKQEIWMDNKFVKWDDAKIHVLTHGLHYGTGVFEGIRCYNTVKGPALFRLSEHIQRFLYSGKIYFMDIGYSKEELEKIVIELIKRNGVKECYVRPIAFYGYGKMGVNPLPNKVSIAIALWKWDEYLKPRTGKGNNSGNKSSNVDYEEGIRVIVSNWTRIDPRSMPVHAKATANYANSALARVEALKAGFDEAILLNSYGKVVEASAENIFMVKDNVLVTPPSSSGSLNGITRDAVLTLSKENNIETKIADFTKDELYIADEVFLTGTAAEIKPIVEIDNRIVGNGKMGDMTKKLKKMFREVVSGNNKKFSKKWLRYVNN